MVSVGAGRLWGLCACSAGEVRFCTSGGAGVWLAWSFSFRACGVAGNSQEECVTGGSALAVPWPACYRWITSRLDVAPCGPGLAAAGAGGFSEPGKTHEAAADRRAAAFGRAGGRADRGGGAGGGVRVARWCLRRAGHDMWQAGISGNCNNPSFCGADGLGGFGGGSSSTASPTGRSPVMRSSRTATTSSVRSPAGGRPMLIAAPNVHI